jgi:hypothetical protein
VLSGAAGCVRDNGVCERGLPVDGCLPVVRGFYR